MFGWQSAWPIEYSVGNLPDPFIQGMNIQSVNCLHTPTEYSVNNLPDPFIHRINIWSVICLIPVYIKWIFSRKSASHTYIHCLLYWYTPETFVMLIEYLVGNNWVIWSLSKAVCLSDTIRYLISDVRKSYNGLLLIGDVIYMYWISLCRLIWYIYYI
jgi:hypothetical protein